MAVLKYKDQVTGEWVAASGPPGEPGEKGEPGEAGYTPVKGTDYWTEADKAEIVNSIDLDALGAVSKDLSNVTGILGVANGGTGVTSLEALAEALGVGSGGGANIEFGTYTGTGGYDYGVSHMNSLTFSFVPKFVFIFSTWDDANGGCLTLGVFPISATQTDTQVYRSGLSIFVKSDPVIYLGYLRGRWENNNTLRWYITGGTTLSRSSVSSLNVNADAQLNRGVRHYYMAIG